LPDARAIAPAPRSASATATACARERRLRRSTSQPTTSRARKASRAGTRRWCRRGRVATPWRGWSSSARTHAANAAASADRTSATDVQLLWRLVEEDGLPVDVGGAGPPPPPAPPPVEARLNEEQQEDRAGRDAATRHRAAANAAAPTAYASGAYVSRTRHRR